MAERSDEDAIREQVQARVRQEEEEAAVQGESPDGNSPPELTHEFVTQCLDANELGDGLIFSALYRGRHVFVGQAGEWMFYRGHHWHMDDIGEANAALADVEGVAEAYLRASDHCHQLAVDAENSEKKEDAARHKRKRDALRARVIRLRSKAGRGNCLSFAKSNREYPLAIRGDEIDRDIWALPMANGVLDLKTGKLRPGRPDDYLLKSSSVEWKGIDEPCPNWERFLLQIMDGDADMVAFIRRVFGCGITGSVKEQKFIVLYGKGRNGKGIMTEMIQEALGGSNSSSALAGPVQSEMLLDQGKNRNAAGPSPDIMSLRGMRLIFASETDEGQRFSAARVKWLSGADKLTGRYPHDKRNIVFDPTHLLCLLTNNKPHAPATDLAFWERLYLVEFPLSFVDRKPSGPNERPVDKEIREQLQAELPGIMAWLVRGCLEWRKNPRGLDPPVKVRDAVAEYRKGEDTLGEFLEDCCEVILENPETVRTSASGLYDAFIAWFRINISAKHDFSQKRFGKLMQERFTRERKGGSYYYYGIRILPEMLKKMEGKKDDSGWLAE